MRHLFKFHGIKTPERKAIVKQFLVGCGKPEYAQLGALLKVCYARPQREFHYFAIQTAAGFVKAEAETMLPHIEYLITHNSWWDSVDAVSSECVRPLFKLRPQLLAKETMRWVKSGNLWLQRSSIIAQLGYRHKTDEEVLYRNILALKDTNEFFLNKAIGWALREYSKTNPGAVKKFMARHKLSALSVREGSKYLN